MIPLQSTILQKIFLKSHFKWKRFKKWLFEIAHHMLVQQQAWLLLNDLRPCFIYSDILIPNLNYCNSPSGTSTKTHNKNGQAGEKTTFSHEIIPLSKTQAGSELLYLYGTDVKIWHLCRITPFWRKQISKLQLISWMSSVNLINGNNCVSR